MRCSFYSIPWCCKHLTERPWSIYLYHIAFLFTYNMFCWVKICCGGLSLNSITPSQSGVMVCFNLWLLSNLSHYNLCIVQYSLSLCLCLSDTKSSKLYWHDHEGLQLCWSKDWQIVDIANKNVNIKLTMGIEYHKIFHFDALRVN